ncbi:DUF4367 domain-containing protein [Paenibacillus puldeungensis]|uniref:DUF4367 domain-containing protein n=1 Tax=Paenibacillus puldeungensis TaxID=696536 RepID=A0ABW3RTJ4_9BACL
MNNRESIRQFNSDLDAHLNGQVNSMSETKEYQDLLDMGKILAAADLGAASHKEAVRGQISEGANSRQPVRTHSHRKLAGSLAVAASFAVLLGTLFTQPSFASGLLDRIITTVTLGHITAFQVASSNENLTYQIPEALQGKVFDHDGNPVNKVNEHTGTLYTVDGQEINDIKNGKIVTKAEADKQEGVRTRTLTDLDRLSQYTDFKVKLPAHLPEGYAFSRAEQYVDEQGGASPKYIDLYFSNGDADKEFSIQERYADDETAYEYSTTGTVEKAKVNGVDAVITDGHSIDWEADGVLYSVDAKEVGEALDKSELIQIAESMK